MNFDLSKVAPFPEKPQAAPATTPSQTFDLSKAKAFGNQTPASTQPPPGLAGGTQGLSFVGGFLDAASKMGAGIINAVLPRGNAASDAVNNSRDFLKMAGNLASAAHPVTKTLGGLTADSIIAAPAIAATSGLGVAGTIAANTALGTAMGAATNPEDGETRGKNAVIGGVSGLASGAVGGLAQAVSNNLPSTLLSKFASQGKLNTEAAQAAERLGVEVSPFELNDSQNLSRAVQKNVRMNPDKIAELSGHLNKRDEVLTQTFNDVMDSIKPKDVDTKAIYDSLKPRLIPETNLEGIVPKVGKDASFAERLYQEAHSPSSGLNFEDIQPGSFEDILKTRQYVNDKIQGLDNSLAAAGNKGISSGKKGASGVDLKEVKSKLTKALMSVSSKDELPLAEKVVKQEGILNSINSKIGDIPLAGRNQDAPHIEQIYQKIAGTPKKQAAFLANVEKTGGDVAKAKDFISVMEATQKSPLNKLLGKPDAPALPVEKLAKAGAAGYLLGDTVGTGTLLGSIGKGLLSSKTYYNQLFKPIEEKAANTVVPGIVKGAGLVGSEESSG